MTNEECGKLCQRWEIAIHDIAVQKIIERTTVSVQFVGINGAFYFEDRVDPRYRSSFSGVLPGASRR
jgi:hypothetical protein